MTHTETDVVVIGSGLAGAAAAWRLAAAGRDVALLERFDVGHAHGSSHGSSRIFRRAYADPFYVQLTGAAEPHWEQLESESGMQLRTFTGGLDAGAKRSVEELADTLRAGGVESQILSSEEVSERWPGLDPHGPAMFHEHAGWLNSDATLSALVALAVRHGAELATGVSVDRLEMTDDGVLVHALGGSTWSARHAVLTMGGWLPEHLPTFLRTAGLDVRIPQISVRQQEVFHFRQSDPAIGYPTIVHKGLGGDGDREFYTLPSGSDGGAAPAMKIGQFDSQFWTSASTRDHVIDPRARRQVELYRERCFPGLEAEPVAAMSCLFTMTSDEDFLIDTAGPITVASACSGHGAKFAPLLGKLIADSAMGGAPLPRFAFRQ